MWSFAHFQTPGALMWFCFCSPSPRITVVCLAQWGNLFGWWQETRTYKSVIKMHSGIAGFIYFLNVWIKYLRLCLFLNFRGTWGIFFSLSIKISRKCLTFVVANAKIFGIPSSLLEILKKKKIKRLFDGQKTVALPSVHVMLLPKAAAVHPPSNCTKKQGIPSLLFSIQFCSWSSFHVIRTISNE